MRNEERASWTRRRDDRRRSDEDWEEETDWENPDVLAFYGGGQAGGVGPELLSPLLLALLREQARPGEREFGVLLNRATGEVLQMVRGTQIRVSFNSHLVNSVDDVAAIHTHNEDTAFSYADWDAFVASDTISVEIIVSSLAIYILHKGPSYDPFPTALGQRSAREYWKQRFDDLEAQASAEAVAGAGYASLTQLQGAVIETINHEMAELFRVDFERIEHQDA